MCESLHEPHPRLSTRLPTLLEGFLQMMLRPHHPRNVVASDRCDLKPPTSAHDTSIRGGSVAHTWSQSSGMVSSCSIP